jgi:hypothetical protein
VTVDGVKHKRVADLVIETAAKLLETLSEQDISSTGIDLLLSAMGYLVAEQRKLDFSKLFAKVSDGDEWMEFGSRLAERLIPDVSALLESHPMLLVAHFKLHGLRYFVDSSYSRGESAILHPPEELI